MLQKLKGYIKLGKQLLNNKYINCIFLHGFIQYISYLFKCRPIHFVVLNEVFHFKPYLCNLCSKFIHGQQVQASDLGSITPLVKLSVTCLQCDAHKQYLS